MASKFILSTDKGTTALSIIGLAATEVAHMPEGNIRSMLLTALSLMGCIVLYLIKGDSKSIDESEPLEDVLTKGRE